jgi:hypothetical protein
MDTTLTGEAKERNKHQGRTNKERENKGLSNYNNITSKEKDQPETGAAGG